MQNMLIDPLKNWKSYNQLIEKINSNNGPIATYGIVDESIGHINYAINEHVKKPVLIVTYDEMKAKKYMKILKNLMKKMLSCLKIEK